MEWWVLQPSLDVTQVDTHELWGDSAPDRTHLSHQQEQAYCTYFVTYHLTGFPGKGTLSVQNTQGEMRQAFRCEKELFWSSKNCPQQLLSISFPQNMHRTLSIVLQQVKLWQRRMKFLQCWWSASWNLAKICLNLISFLYEIWQGETWLSLGTFQLYTQTQQVCLCGMHSLSDCLCFLLPDAL